MPLNKDIVIKLTNISKKYTLFHEKPTLVENIFSRKQNEEFWALKDINLEVRKGERVGIIGPNGSGKTTLLEIMAGITLPTTGMVETYGKIVSLIDLEAGFHPELTGEENIYLSGMLIGMTKQEIVRNFKKIINFADIGRFIDTPLYMYSKGMKLRLGFSILVNSNPEITLLDENLSVGDAEFQEKSISKIKDLISKGVTAVMCSHQPYYIKLLCDCIVILVDGKIKRIGDSKLINWYLSFLRK